MMLAYRVLEAGGGAEGAVVTLGDGEGAWRGAGEGEGFLALFSCSFRDIAMASCRSSSSWSCCSVPLDPAPLPEPELEPEEGTWDS